jgi:hypothetical protein
MPRVVPRSIAAVIVSGSILLRTALVEPVVPGTVVEIVTPGLKAAGFPSARMICSELGGASAE